MSSSESSSHSKSKSILAKAIQRSQAEAKSLLNLGFGADGDNLVAALSRWNNCDAELVSLLIRAGANVNHIDQEGSPVLHHALRPNLITSNQALPILEILLESGVDVNMKNASGETALEMVLSRKRLWPLRHRVVEKILEAKPVDTQTALANLMEMEEYGGEHAQCVRVLVEHGTTPVHNTEAVLAYCILKKYGKAIRVLVQSGIVPQHCRNWMVDEKFTSCPSEISITPFCLALLTGNLELAQFFLSVSFLAHSDVYILSRSSSFRDYLGVISQRKSVTFLEQFATEPLKLFQLSFLAVSDLLGSSSGRDDRVKVTGLPVWLQQKLLFQHQDGQLDIPEEEEDEKNEAVIVMSGPVWDKYMTCERNP